MQDDAPKSAYEIALEKLKERDRERGEKAPARLTDRQKQQISEIRSQFEARLAEKEIIHQSEREKSAGDPEILEKLDQEFAMERRKIEEERDRRIAKVWKGNRS